LGDLSEADAMPKILSLIAGTPLAVTQIAERFRTIVISRLASSRGGVQGTFLLTYDLIARFNAPYVKISALIHGAIWTRDLIPSRLARLEGWQIQTRRSRFVLSPLLS